MSEAPERIWYPSWIETPNERTIIFGPDNSPHVAAEVVEYIRADLVEAAVKRALEGAAECCDVAAQDGIGDIVRAKGDEIRQLDPAQFTEGEK